MSGTEQLEERQMLAGDVVKIDVNTNPWPGSFPSAFVEFNDKLLFTAQTDTSTRLFSTDGTDAGTVPLYAGASLLSNVSNLLDVNGTLFFGGGTDDQTELWKSDGTLTGAVLVKEINLEPNNNGTTYSSYPSNLTNVNGTLFFTADDGFDSHGRELWKSDGTEEGTVLIKDIRAGTYSSYPSNLTAVNGMLFFTADDGIHGTELWKSDGTEAGTVLVRDIRPGTSEDETLIYSSYPSGLTVLGDLLYFAADDGEGGSELWRSDGTEAGTVRVKDINPGPTASGPTSLINLDGMLFFSADDAVNGTELWRSDGTEFGTTLVRDINPGEAGSTPNGLFNLNGTLVFAADDGMHGRELWRSDGTELGTTLIQDINSGTASSAPGRFVVADDVVYFQADDGIHGAELWRSAGSPEETMLAADFEPGPVGSAPVPLFANEGTIYVSAKVDPYGVELWKTDGTQAGIQFVKDIQQGTWPSDFDRFGFGIPLAFKGELFFSADTGPGAIDYELWKTDGTQAGTVMVKNINPADRSTGYRIGSKPIMPTIVGDTLFFMANDGMHGHELWKTDGTEAGTVLVKDINPGSSPSNSPYGFSLTRNAVSLNGQILFKADDGVLGSELWRSDGTEEGTVLVKDINPSGGSSISSLTQVNDRIFFTADDGAHGVELWTSDGTEAGTRLVIDLNPGSISGPQGDLPNSSNPSGLIETNGTLLFTANDGTHGNELWISDGTEAGTFLVADINPGGADSSAAQFTNLSGSVFFQADDGVNGLEFWHSDGTSAGTVMVADINPGTQGSSPTSLTTSGNGVIFYFSADDGTHGNELWRSDGTPEGTLLVADVNPGPGDSILRQPPFIGNFGTFANVQDEVFLAADDGVHGVELWGSDGTTAGTDLIADVLPGSQGSAPWDMAFLNNAVYFTAPADGLYELFKADLVERLPGDADGNGQVDFADFTVLANNFGRDGQFTFDDGDFDLDGRVQFSDFLILSNNYGRSATPPPVDPAVATAAHVQAIDLAFAEPSRDGDDLFVVFD